MSVCMQNFMCWSWFNFDYWHMGILNAIVILTSGFSVSYFSFRSQKILGRCGASHQFVCHVVYGLPYPFFSHGVPSIAKLEGSFEVLRGGQGITLPARYLVPGDVIFLQVRSL
jgi:hypothetical protein